MELQVGSGAPTKIFMSTTGFDSKIQRIIVQTECFPKPFPLSLGNVSLWVNIICCYIIIETAKHRPPPKKTIIPPAFLNCLHLSLAIVVRELSQITIVNHTSA